MTVIKADFGNILGEIRPLHGFNNTARKTDYGELLPDFVKLNPPFVRLHDTGGTYGGTHYVDVPNIFPDFSKDENDENSYDFTLTDCYIKPIVEAGAKIMYRLGVTIEHEPKKYRIFPPEPHKWARICEHIVRHYNEGWADGFHFNIEYWEIWNEPDALDPACEPYGCPNWTGSAEEYYELYSVTANHLKKCHPDIKVGGYSSCYILGAFREGRWVAGPADFFFGFLEFISNEKTKAPLDFFTYHGYLGAQYIEKIDVEAEFVNKTLDKYGFNATERINTEWNTNICDIETEDRRTQYYVNMRNEKGASHAAAAMYEMQRNRIDSAMFYDTQLWLEYGCLFDLPSLAPTKTYYAFSLFGELYGLRNHCLSTQDKNLFTCAASGEYDMLCISNVSPQAREIKLSINSEHNNYSFCITDKEHTNEKTEIPDITRGFTMPGYSFITVRITD